MSIWDFETQFKQVGCKRPTLYSPNLIFLNATICISFFIVETNQEEVMGHSWLDMCCEV